MKQNSIPNFGLHCKNLQLSIFDQHRQNKYTLNKCFVKKKQKYESVCGYSNSGLRNPLEPWSRAARKWKENEEMKRKWRENEEMEREGGKVKISRIKQIAEIYFFMAETSPQSDLLPN